MMLSALTAGGCRMWQAGFFTSGYGEMGDGRYAHRAAYEAFVGPLVAKMHIHHLCFNRGCVEPTHLVQLTPKAHGAAHRKARLKERRSVKTELEVQW